MAVDALKGALLQTDVEIDPTRMEKALHWVYKSDQLNDIEPLEQSKVIERLQNLDIYRTGRKI